MNDIPVYWLCPVCKTENLNHRNVDEVCLCMGYDCYDARGKRHVATWDEIERAK